MKQSAKYFRRLSALLLILLSAHQAAAQETARDVIEPQLTQQQFAELCAPLDLDRDQQIMKDIVFSDYAANLQDLIARTDDAAEQAGRSTINEAFTGRTRVDAAQLQQMRLAVVEAYAAAIHEAEALAGDLTASLASVITQDQEKAYEEALIDMRRTITLAERRRNETSYDYAGDGVDIVQLIHEASQPDGELHSLAERTLEPILHSYRQEMDLIIQTTADGYRNRQFAARRVSITKDSIAQAALQKEALRDWQRLYDVQQAAAGRIAAAAEESLGTEARGRWMTRFNAAVFPWLYGDDEVDMKTEWIIANPRSNKQQQRASELYVEYTQNRGELRDEAAGAMLGARMQLGGIVHAMMAPGSFTDARQRDLYEQLVKNSGRLKTLANEAVAQLEDLLTDKQRSEMQRDLRSKR